MFRKEPQLAERSRSLLKSKETRALRAALLAQLPALTEETLTLLLPAKAEVTAIKLVNRTILYGVEGLVLFFDLEGRNRLFPTVHALWKCPHILRTMVCHAPVSRFVFRGADFMAPGLATIDGLDNLRVGERCCLRIRGNPMPFAVGESLVDFSLLSGGPRSVKGKAMTVIHMFGDLLADKAVPNVGFSLQEVRPIHAEGGTSTDLDDDDDDDDNDDESQGDGSGEGNAGSSAGEAAETHQPPLAEATGGAVETTEVADATGQDEGGDDSDDGADDTQQATREEADAMLERALVLALRYVVKDAQLPLLASTLGALLLRCHSAVSPNRRLDIKRSSHRKIGAFLDACRRNGILSLQTSDGVTQVVSVNRGHALARAHKVEDAEAFKALVCDAAPASAAAAAAGRVEVVELVKLPKKLREIFGAREGAFGDLLRLNEARELLTAFVRDHGLEAPGARQDVLLRRDEHPDLFAMLRPLAKQTPPVAPLAAAPAPALTSAAAEDEEAETAGPWGSWVRGAPAPPSSSAAWPALKVRAEGLISLDALSSSLPAPSPAPTGPKGGAWRPVALPAAAPSKPAAPAKGPPLTLAAKQAQAMAKEKKEASRRVAQALAEAQAGEAELVLRKEDFVKGCLAKMTPYHAVLSPGPAGTSAEIFSGSAPRVHISMERRQGNKMVTLLRGLEHFGQDLTELAKKLQKRFACSVSVGVVPGMVKQREVVLQGSSAQELEAFLCDHCGLSKHFFDTQAPVKAKKK